jgi:hypothetical protein
LERWRPLSHRSDPSWDALTEGIPSWLKTSLEDWVRDRITDSHGQADRGKLQVIERALKSPLDWTMGETSAQIMLLQTRAKSSDDYLELIDAILYELTGPVEANELSDILKHGGSVWTVVPRDEGPRHYQFGLERRVESAVADFVREVMSSSAKAGQHLRIAWHAVYGRAPKPTEAYWESVRAVEAAGKPTVSPTNDSTTLGTMITDMRLAPIKWRMTFQPKSAVDPIETLIGMMRLLWKSHTDRHGTPDESVEVSEELEVS